MSGWRPIVDGPSADRIHSIVRTVSERAATSELPAGSLGAGLLPAALLFAQLARGGDDEAFDRAGNALEAALERFADIRSPWLIDGLAGIGWTLAHCSDLLEVDDETFESLDQMILELVAQDVWRGEWEHLYGLVGLGVYAIERKGSAAGHIQGHVLRHLAALAEREGDAIRWRSNSDFLLSGQVLEANPDGYYNLGLAHGTTGVIALLSHMADDPLAGELLAGAIHWYRTLDTGDDSGRFPIHIALGNDARRQVEGWCYGDQAVALAIVNAGRATGHASWIDYGRGIAHSVIGREPGQSIEPWLCHGALGRAHMFNRIGQMLGDESLLAAGRHWYLRCLDQWQEPRDSPDDLYQLLEGQIGLALGLAGAISPTPPDWDRSLLCGPAAGVTEGRST
jgi:lantibiotic biosynthesis protein